MFLFKVEEYYDPNLDPTPVVIPYRAIFKPELVPLDKIPITLDVSYEEQKGILSSYIYQIKLKQGEFEWKIQKSFAQITNFHNQAKIFIISYNIPYIHNKEDKEKLKNENLTFPYFKFFTESFASENPENRKVCFCIVFLV